MIPKIKGKAILGLIISIILIIEITNLTHVVAVNTTTNLPTGGLPVYAKNFKTNSTYHMQQITSNGTHIFAVSVDASTAFIYTIGGKFVKAFGSYGFGNGQLDGPLGIVYANNRLYIADSYNNRIEVFTTNGDYISQFGTSGSGNGQLSEPLYLAADSNYIYVTDYNNARIVVFDFSGNFIRNIGSAGTSPSQFNDVESVAVSNGFVYAPDRIQETLKIFDTFGNFIKQISDTGLSKNGLYFPTTITVSKHFIYVGNAYNGNLLVFDLNGTYQCTYYGSGTGPSQISQTGGLIFLNSVLYAVDMGGQKINEYVFLDNPTNLDTFSGLTSISLAWQSPSRSNYIPIKSYQIYRSTDGINFKMYAVSTYTYFEDNNILPGTTYHYMVDAVAENASVGISGFSNIANGTLTNPSSLNLSGSNSTTNGFLPFDVVFMLFGFSTMVVIIKRWKRR